MNSANLKSEAKHVLLLLIDSIKMLTKSEYTEKINILSNSSIGEHTRHIIELFHQLLNGYETGMVNYDERKRDLRLQEDLIFATKTIEEIIVGLEKKNKSLQVFTLCDSEAMGIDSNFQRELLYNIEHCIHHQAMIKVALMQINKMMADESFGVAKSTLNFKKKCAQ